MHLHCEFAILEPKYLIIEMLGTKRTFLLAHNESPEAYIQQSPHARLSKNDASRLAGLQDSITGVSYTCSSTNASSTSLFILREQNNAKQAVRVLATLSSADAYRNGMRVLSSNKELCTPFLAQIIFEEAMMSSNIKHTTKAAPARSANDPFHPTLTVFDMVVYGLISMVPIAPMAIYGGVFQASNGMPALAYLIGFIAVLFSVFSFGIMIQHFPSSGSIYTYASHIMGKGMGFLTGWLMLLQYLITPTLMYIIAGTALHGFIPAIPIWGWCLIFWAFVAVVSLRGMKTTMVVNRIALVAELIILGIFVVLGIAYITQHPATSGFTATALFNPDKFNFGDTMSAVSLAVLSYVGFGCIATLTQEAKDEKQGPPRAMLIMALALVVLFAGQCYIATCIDPSGSVFAHNPDNGFYLVAQMIAGPWLAIACAVAVALSQGVFTALVSQTSVALILFSMAKGGSLPAKLGTLKKGTNLPLVATIFVLALSLALIFVMEPLGMNMVAKVSNFGALATYTILNLCVIWFCWFQLKEHRKIFTRLIFPALGAIICFVILISLGTLPLVVGGIWIVLGIVYYCVVRFGMHRNITLG